MIPSRELYLNITAHLWLYPLFLPFLATFLYGSYRLGRLLWAGQPADGIPPLRWQCRDVLWQAILQRRMLRQPLDGSMHAAI